MFDFRLRVFHAVARRLSFTRAAAELDISQPAVSQHIQEMEQHYKIKLFDRSGSQVQLTAAGLVLFQAAGRILDIHRQLKSDMDVLSQSHQGQIRIAAGDTVAQYLLPELLAAFRNRYPRVRVSVAVCNTNRMEAGLIAKEFDLGITEDASSNRQLEYTDYATDELVLTGSPTALTGSPTAITGSPAALIASPGIRSLKLAELRLHPFVMHASNSATQALVTDGLEQAGVRLRDLQTLMQFESTESIKQYLLHSGALAFLSIHSIQPELSAGTLTRIHVDGLDLKRSFRFAGVRNLEKVLVNLLIKFASNR